MHIGQAGSQYDGSWHLHAIRLPDGIGVEDWWIANGILHDTPIPGASDLPGGWFLPGGLIDAHAHLTMNFNGFDLRDGSDELIAANVQAQRAAGILGLRDAGLAWGGKRTAQPTHGPRVQSAGRLLAAPERGYPQICQWVPADQLVHVALAEVHNGVPWVKILADFPGPDGNWFAAPPSYPLEVLHTLVQEVHAAGARVMAHSTGLAAADLVKAGVDSIEHGMQLNRALVETMAQHKIAWTLTLATALKHVGPLAALDNPIGAAIRAELARVGELLALAASLGVPLMAGTDELAHGALAEEVMALHNFGLTPSQAIAVASTSARTYLGLPAFTTGAPADLVTFMADPRLNLAALAQPAAILFNGQKID